MQKQIIIGFISSGLPTVVLDWNGDGRPLESKLKLYPVIYQRQTPERQPVQITITIEPLEKKGFAKK